jgi:hypothetical protein
MSTTRAETCGSLILAMIVFRAFFAAVSTDNLKTAHLLQLLA